VPRTEVALRLAVDGDELWRLVGDPGKRPRWWPNVDRVDRPDPATLVKWVISPRGKAVEMRYTLAEAGPGLRLRWAQQLEGGPFERSLRSCIEEIRVEQEGESSVLRLSIERKLRGTAALGGVFIARGQRRELRAALDRVQERFGG